MQIERHDDGAVGADDLADRFDEIAVTVINPDHDHRSVQIEQHAIDRSPFLFRLAQKVQKLAFERFVILFHNQASGISERPEEGDEFKLVKLGTLDKPARADVRPTKPPENFWSPVNPKARFKVRNAGRNRGKRAGFMRYSTDCNTHVHSLKQGGLVRMEPSVTLDGKAATLRTRG